MRMTEIMCIELVMSIVHDSQGQYELATFFFFFFFFFFFSSLSFVLLVDEQRAVGTSQRRCCSLGCQERLSLWGESGPVWKDKWASPEWRAGVWVPAKRLDTSLSE